MLCAVERADGFVLEQGILEERGTDCFGGS